MKSWPLTPATSHRSLVAAFCLGAVSLFAFTAIPIAAQVDLEPLSSMKARSVGPALRTIPTVPASRAVRSSCRATTRFR